MNLADLEPEVQTWTAWATTTLAEAAAGLRVLAANTPRNLRGELDRLDRAWSAGDAVAPQFVYEATIDTSIARRALAEVAADAGRGGPLGGLYGARAQELITEAELCEAAGSVGLWAVARRRYARRDRYDDDADATAVAWLAEGTPAETTGERVWSDDERSPFSLVTRMRCELGRRRVPFRVILKDNLASLAATGDGFVHIARRRSLLNQDVERTVLHEISGHVEPQLAAKSRSPGIYRTGTAYGSDDQEGRALALERAGGFLDGRRRRELAMRHVAARSVEARAGFVETTRLLLGYEAPRAQALAIAARVHRGGGLAREVVYLPALLRVEGAIARDPEAATITGRGRVSVDAVPILRALDE